MQSLLEIIFENVKIENIEQAVAQKYYKNFPSWEHSVDRLIISEEKPQTDERVYLTTETRYASTMTEHLHRYRLARIFSFFTYNILDLGCGSGYGTALLKETSTVIGVDYNKEAVAWAKKYYPWIDCRVMDACNLSFPHEWFRFVVSMEVIEHIDDINIYLSEVIRVLHDEGFFLFSTPYTPDPNGKCTHNPAGFPHKWGFTHDFLQKKLEEYFNQVKIFSQIHDNFMHLTIPCYYIGLCWSPKK